MFLSAQLRALPPSFPNSCDIAVQSHTISINLHPSCRLDWREIPDDGDLLSRDDQSLCEPVPQFPLDNRRVHQLACSDDIP